LPMDGNIYHQSLAILSIPAGSNSKQFASPFTKHWFLQWICLSS